MARLYFFFRPTFCGFHRATCFSHTAFCHPVSLLNGGLAFAFCLRPKIVYFFCGSMGNLRSLTDTLFRCFTDGFTELPYAITCAIHLLARSEEHTSELQSLMRISYAVFCLQKKTN